MADEEVTEDDAVNDSGDRYLTLDIDKSGEVDYEYEPNRIKYGAPWVRKILNKLGFAPPSERENNE